MNPGNPLFVLTCCCVADLLVLIHQLLITLSLIDLFHFVSLFPGALGALHCSCRSVEVEIDFWIWSGDRFWSKCGWWRWGWGPKFFFSCLGCQVDRFLNVCFSALILSVILSFILWLKIRVIPKKISVERYLGSPLLLSVTASSLQHKQDSLTICYSCGSHVSMTKKMSVHCNGWKLF